MTNQFTEDAYQKYFNVAQKALPIAVLWLMGDILNRIHAISEQAAIYFIICGFATTIVWMLLEMVSTNADSDVMMDLHDKLDAIDRSVQAQIYAGLQYIRFLNEFVEAPDEMQRRVVINGIASRALVPSVFQNHHCRELGNPSSNRDYLWEKCRLVMQAFSNDRYHLEYQQLVMNRLPKGVAFEAAVGSYVHSLLLEVIIPALITACDKKIAYYDSLLKRKSISRKLREEIKGWRAKNMGYIAAISELRMSSSLITSSMISRENLPLIAS